MSEVGAVWSWDGVEPRDDREIDWPCDECGLPHTQARRLAVLRRLLPRTSEEIQDAWPHLWPAGGRTLNRDLHSLGALRSANGVWGLS